MGMIAILFNGAEPFKHIVITLSTESPMWNLVKVSEEVSEKKKKKKKKKTFKKYTILYMYIAQRQGHTTPKWQNFDCS